MPTGRNVARCIWVCRWPCRRGSWTEGWSHTSRWCTLGSQRDSLELARSLGKVERPTQGILDQLLSRERGDLRTSLKADANLNWPLNICCRLGGSSCLNLCFGESVMNLACSGEQLKLCLSTGRGSALGRNQKGMADMSVMVPAMR